MSEQAVHISGDLTGTTIYIVSSFVLNSQSLASLITLRTNANCICVKTFGEIIGHQHEHKHPLLILWDCSGKDFGAFTDGLTPEMKVLASQNYIVLFNVRQGDRIEESCLTEGVRGVFYEDAGVDIFLKGLCAIFKGELWFSRESMTRYILEERGSTAVSLKARSILTGREIEILSLLAIGCKNTDIAERLCVSPHTIKTHLYNIYKKISVSSRLQAILWAAKNL